MKRFLCGLIGHPLQKTHTSVVTNGYLKKTYTAYACGCGQKTSEVVKAEFCERVKQ